MELEKLTIRKAHKAIGNGDFSAVALTEAYLKKSEEKNADLNAYIELFDDALEQAKNADERVKTGHHHSLNGIPLGIKDNILIRGKKATAASRVLEGYTATYDAHVIQKMKEEGAVFLGRTNCDEFAMGSSTESSAYGVTKNPHDTSRVPGGSSGGSAAVVAADMALASLGSDTGGSIRQPASFCGVVGLKPTYGSVSRSGLIALASSLDVIGPFAKTVADTEILFNVIKGKDVKDATSYSAEYESHNAQRIGVPRSLIERDGIDEMVLKNFNESLEKLEGLGYEVVDIELPHIEHSLAVYYILMPAEASSNLARFDGVKYGLHKEGDNLLGDYLKTRGEGFGEEVRRRIILGTYVLSAGYYDAYYGKATAVREVITQSFQNAFQDVDVIATPTTPSAAFGLGEKVSDPLQMYLSDIFTVPANIAGIPGLSIPSGDVDGLPLGLQLLGPHDGEQVLFEVGKTFLGE